MFKLRLIYLPVLLTLVFTIGCGPAQDSPGDADAGHSEHDGHDQDAHGHEGHNHEALGPNGGHILMVGDEAYHVEWIHDDEAGKVTAILLDSEMKNEVTTAAEVVTVTVEIGAAEPRVYELLAVDQSDDTPPQASRFELTEPALITALEIGEGVQVVMGLEIDGQTFSVPIEHEAHDEHAGHQH